MATRDYFVELVVEFEDFELWSKNPAPEAAGLCFEDTSTTRCLSVPPKEAKIQFLDDEVKSSFVSPSLSPSARRFHRAFVYAGRDDLDHLVDVIQGHPAVKLAYLSGCASPPLSNINDVCHF